MRIFDKTVLTSPYGDTTFAIIKPDADPTTQNKILQLIKEEGLTVLHIERTVLTPTQADALYFEHIGKSFFPTLKEFMTGGQSVVMALQGPQAQKIWREKLMPRIRGEMRDPSSLPHQNLVHGSDCEKSAVYELLYFFG